MMVGLFSFFFHCFRYGDVLLFLFWCVYVVKWGVLVVLFVHLFGFVFYLYFRLWWLVLQYWELNLIPCT